MKNAVLFAIVAVVGQASPCFADSILSHLDLACLGAADSSKVYTVQLGSTEELQRLTNKVQTGTAAKQDFVVLALSVRSYGPNNQAYSNQWLLNKDQFSFSQNSQNSFTLTALTNPPQSLNCVLDQISYGNGGMSLSN